MSDSLACICRTYTWLMKVYIPSVAYITIGYNGCSTQKTTDSIIHNTSDEQEHCTWQEKQMTMSINTQFKVIKQSY